MTTAVRHGGNVVEVAARLGCRVEEILDMSSNLSPLGMVPGLKDELVSRIDELNYLPESDSSGLRRAFAARHGLDPEQALAGSGTTEFIFSIPECVPAGRAVIVEPTYGDYAVACGRAGLEAVSFMLRPEEDFFLDLDRLDSFVRKGDLVFVCNPNNPTARLTGSRALYGLVRARGDVVFVVDESYIHFLDSDSLLDFSPFPENLLLLSSYSKIFGIPGIRLGFAAAAPRLLAPFREKGRPWGVNRLAQIAGEFVLSRGRGYQDEVRRLVAAERPRVAAALAALPGIRPVPGEANFILSRTERLGADELGRRLIEKRIMIRDCANFTGLDHGYFRISLKKPQDNDRFLRELALAL